MVVLCTFVCITLNLLDVGLYFLLSKLRNSESKDPENNQCDDQELKKIYLKTC